MEHSKQNQGWVSIDLNQNSDFEDVVNNQWFKDWMEANGFEGFDRSADIRQEESCEFLSLNLISSQRTNIEFSLVIQMSPNHKILVPYLVNKSIGQTESDFKVSTLLDSHEVYKFTLVNDDIEGGLTNNRFPYNTPFDDQGYAFPNCVACGMWDLSQSLDGMVALACCPVSCLVGSALACASTMGMAEAQELAFSDQISWADEQVATGKIHTFEFTIDEKLILK